MAKTGGVKNKVVELLTGKGKKAPKAKPQPVADKTPAKQALISRDAVLGLLAEESDSQSARENGQAWVNCAVFLAEKIKQLPHT